MLRRIHVRGQTCNGASEATFCCLLHEAAGLGAATETMYNFFGQGRKLSSVCVGTETQRLICRSPFSEKIQSSKREHGVLALSI
jgi:hypothetical protein